MLQNGLRSKKRDYTHEELHGFTIHRGLSVFTSSLYVAGDPANFSGYGASSPEWLSFFISENHKTHESDPSYQGIIQRYSGKTHFVLIQIQTAPKVLRDTYHLTKISELSTQPSLSDQTRQLLVDLIFHPDNNRNFLNH